MSRIVRSKIQQKKKCFWGKIFNVPSSNLLDLGSHKAITIFYLAFMCSYLWHCNRNGLSLTFLLTFRDIFCIQILCICVTINIYLLLHNHLELIMWCNCWMNVEFGRNLKFSYEEKVSKFLKLFTKVWKLNLMDKVWRNLKSLTLLKIYRKN